MEEIAPQPAHVAASTILRGSASNSLKPVLMILKSECVQINVLYSGTPELKSYKAVNWDTLSSLPELTSEETTTQVVEVAFSDVPGNSGRVWIRSSCFPLKVHGQSPVTQ